MVGPAIRYPSSSSGSIRKSYGPTEGGGPEAGRVTRLLGHVTTIPGYCTLSRLSARLRLRAGLSSSTREMLIMASRGSWKMSRVPLESSPRAVSKSQGPVRSLRGSRKAMFRKAVKTSESTKKAHSVRSVLLFHHRSRSTLCGSLSPLSSMLITRPVAAAATRCAIALPLQDIILGSAVPFCATVMAAHFG